MGAHNHLLSDLFKCETATVGASQPIESLDSAECALPYRALPCPLPPPTYPFRYILPPAPYPRPLLLLHVLHVLRPPPPLGGGG